MMTSGRPLRPGIDEETLELAELYQRFETFGTISMPGRDRSRSQTIA